MKSTKYFLLLAVIWGVAGLTRTHAIGESLQYIIVNKTLHYKQTAVGTASAGLSDAWSFGSYIIGNGLTGSYPSGTSTLTTPSPATINYVFNSMDADWSLVGQAGFRYDNMPALNAAFPNGAYGLSVGSSSGSLNLVDDLYSSTTPLMTFSAGTWSGGTLILTPAEAAAGFTITANAFADWNSASRIGMDGWGPGYNASSSTFANDILTLNVGAGALVSGQNYSFGLEFAHFSATNNTSFDALTGSPDAVALYAVRTELYVHVVPEPSAYAVFVGLGALAGAAFWRRRRI